MSPVSHYAMGLLHLIIFDNVYLQACGMIITVIGKGLDEQSSNPGWYCCDGKSTKIPKRDFIFARVKTGQVGTWSPTE